MIERPNPHALRDDYIPSEAIRLATFRQSENTRDGQLAPFQAPPIEEVIRHEH